VPNLDEPEPNKFSDASLSSVHGNDILPISHVLSTVFTVSLQIPVLFYISGALIAICFQNALKNILPKNTNIRRKVPKITKRVAIKMLFRPDSRVKKQ
jgi:hypothetical protein